MCGIVGYVGVRQAAPILLDGLSRLEYRGYDSAGIAVRDEQSAHIEVVKAKGRLTNLMQMTYSGRAVSAPAASAIRAGRRTASQAPSTHTRIIRRKSAW